MWCTGRVPLHEKNGEVVNEGVRAASFGGGDAAIQKRKQAALTANLVGAVLAIESSDGPSSKRPKGQSTLPAIVPINFDH